MNPYPKRPPPYPYEYKLKAVLLSLVRNASTSHTARELGIPEGVLLRWCRQIRQHPETIFSGWPEQSESEQSESVPSDLQFHIVVALDVDVHRLSVTLGYVRNLLYFDSPIDEIS